MAILADDCIGRGPHAQPTLLAPVALQTHNSFTCAFLVLQSLTSMPPCTQVKTSPVPQKPVYFATLKSTNYLVRALQLNCRVVHTFCPCSM